MKDDVAPGSNTNANHLRQQHASPSGELAIGDAAHLLDTIAAGVVRVSAEGRITYLNGQLRRLVTGNDPLGRSLHDYEPYTVKQDGTPCGYEDYPPIKCLRTGEAQPPMTIGVRRPDQPMVWVSVTAEPLFDPRTGQAESALVTVVDSRHPVHVEERLRESEDRYRRLVELAPDAIVVHRGGTIRFINAAGVKLWGGRSREEFIGRDILEFVHPKYRDAAVARIAKVIGGESTTPTIHRHVRLDGSIVPVEVVGTPCIYEGHRCAQVIFRDVSRRMRAARQLRRAKADLERRVAERTEELSRKNAELRRKQRFMERALDRHERDRKLVAYEIHDTILQDVIGALMFVDTAIDAPEGVDNAAALAQARDLLRHCIDGSRRMISGLRPPIIDEQGVQGSIEYLVSELGGRGLQVDFTHDLQSERLPAELETTIFRIVQEALANIERHSGSAQGEVSITERDGTIHIEVRDAGVGFDPEQVAEGHFGLEGIRERARLSGGWADIVSAEGQGTRVTVELPVALESPAAG